MNSLNAGIYTEIWYRYQALKSSETSMPAHTKARKTKESSILQLYDDDNPHVFSSCTIL